MAIVRFINGMVDPLQTGMYISDAFGVESTHKFRTIRSSNFTYRRIAENPAIPHLPSAQSYPRRFTPAAATETGRPLCYRVYQSILVPAFFG
jgi:hypothetical protein